MREERTCRACPRLRWGIFLLVFQMSKLRFREYIGPHARKLSLWGRCDWLRVQPRDTEWVQTLPPLIPAPLPLPRQTLPVDFRGPRPLFSSLEAGACSQMLCVHRALRSPALRPGLSLLELVSLGLLSRESNSPAQDPETPPFSPQAVNPRKSAPFSARLPGPSQSL